MRHVKTICNRQVIKKTIFTVCELVNRLTFCWDCWSLLGVGKVASLGLIIEQISPLVDTK